MGTGRNKMNVIFLSFVIILLIGVLVFSTIKVIKYIIDNKQNKKIEEISDLVEYVEESTNNEEWKEVEENRFITFITEKESCIYKVFSVYQIEAEDYYMRAEFKNNQEFLKFLIIKVSSNNIPSRVIYSSVQSCFNITKP